MFVILFQIVTNKFLYSRDKIITFLRFADNLNLISIEKNVCIYSWKKPNYLIFSSI